MDPSSLFERMIITNNGNTRIIKFLVKFESDSTVEKSVWKAIPRFNYRESIKWLGTILFEENEIAALRKNQPSTQIPGWYRRGNAAICFRICRINHPWISCRARLPIRSIEMRSNEWVICENIWSNVSIYLFFLEIDTNNVSYFPFVVCINYRVSRFVLRRCLYRS